MKPFKIISVSNALNHLLVCKYMSSGSFKNNATYELFVYISFMYIIYIYLWIGFGMK